MIPKKLGTAELEAVHDLIAEALDALPADQRLLFLAKLSLGLANLVGDAALVEQAVRAAGENLGAEAP